MLLSRLDVSRNHFCNRVVSLWNGLPEHVASLFKKYLRTGHYIYINFLHVMEYNIIVYLGNISFVGY